MNIDPDTNEIHIAPCGLERHQERRSGTIQGYFACCNMKHFIIREHQQLFPKLAEQMKQNPRNASNIYSAFLACLPLQMKGKLTPELKLKILRTYKVI